MQDISWSIFTATGNIETYLLYKEHEKIVMNLEEEVEKWKEPTDALG